ncbi:HEPN domain-containing protein [Caldivirga sp.]|uniref:HEPN domain-containing protein n=1 Tax=Caldivirga sp. TaxID=2080243 RepID=UPI003D0E5A3D
MSSRWFNRAERYRELSRDMVNRGLYDEACFFAQQAVEFYIKGKLIELTGARPYTYSIVALLEQLLSILQRKPRGEVIKCAKTLTEQYISSRYPDARMLDYDRDDAEECIKCMELVLSNVV